jgi:hypothetical protein
VWYCTSLQIPTLPGWLEKSDQTFLPFVQCKRASPDVVAENGLDLARAFRVVVRIAESFP